MAKLLFVFALAAGACSKEGSNSKPSPQASESTRPSVRWDDTLACIDRSRVSTDHGYAYYFAIVSSCTQGQDEVDWSAPYAGLENASGIPFSLGRFGGDAGFYRVNPAFVQWARNSLILDPQVVIGGDVAKEQYHRIRYLCRGLLEAYLLTKSRSALKKGFETYRREAARQADDLNTSEDRWAWNGASFAREVVWDAVEEHEFAAYEPRSPGNYFESEVSGWVSFWWRRSIDGSEEELWQSLHLVMTKYDPEFLQQALSLHGCTLEVGAVTCREF